MLKLFKLEMKDNDVIIVASDIRAIMHKIQAIGMQPNLPLASFFKPLYPTHWHYLESLQVSDKLKDLVIWHLGGENYRHKEILWKEDQWS